MNLDNRSSDGITIPSNLSNLNPELYKRNKALMRNLNNTNLVNCGTSNDQNVFDTTNFNNNYSTSGPPFSSKFLNVPLPDHYICKICLVPGHWIYNCPTIPKTDQNTNFQFSGHQLSKKSLPTPINYVCKLCSIPGHWAQDCPGIVDSDGNIQVPTVTMPPTYVCNKCFVPGHWIQHCPGIFDKDGNLLNSRKIKRPSGIPTTKLREVDPRTPNCYLTLDGRYVVNAIDQMAPNTAIYKQPLSKVGKPTQLICGICNNIMRNPVSTPCCDTTYCRYCVRTFIFHDEMDSFHNCPNCRSIVDGIDSFTDDILIRELIDQWELKKLSNEDVERLIKTRERKSMKEVVRKKKNAGDNDDLTDDIFSLSKMDDQIMLTTEDYIRRNVEKNEETFCDRKRRLVGQDISVIDGAAPVTVIDHQHSEYVDGNYGMGAGGRMLGGPSGITYYNGPGTIINAYQEVVQPIQDGFYRRTEEDLQIEVRRQKLMEMEQIERDMRQRHQENEFLKKITEEKNDRKDLRHQNEIYISLVDDRSRSRSKYSVDNLWRNELKETSSYTSVDQNISQSRSKYRKDTVLKDKRKVKSRSRHRSGSRSKYYKAKMESDHSKKHSIHTKLSRNRERSRSKYSKNRIESDKRREEMVYSSHSHHRSQSRSKYYHDNMKSDRRKEENVHSSYGRHGSGSRSKYGKDMMESDRRKYENMHDSFSRHGSGSRSKYDKDKMESDRRKQENLHDSFSRHGSGIRSRYGKDMTESDRRKDEHRHSSFSRRGSESRSRNCKDGRENNKRKVEYMCSLISRHRSGSRSRHCKDRRESDQRREGHVNSSIGSHRSRSRSYPQKEITEWPTYDSKEYMNYLPIADHGYPQSARHPSVPRSPERKSKYSKEYF